MTIENAIEKAIEGGYMAADGVSLADGLTEKNGFWQFFLGKENIADRTVDELVLDPSFWQCLGKAMGWTEKAGYYNGKVHDEQWRERWHRLIDHLAEGKDIESYFEKL